MSADGLAFTRMSLPQQQRYIALALRFDDQPLQSLEELNGAIMRVVYTHPGGYEWLPPGPNWLGQKYYAMTAVVVVNVWRGLPFFAITILAGLVSIPRELYEAAEADGAGPVTRFWYITLPLLKPVLAVVVLFSTIFTFSDFNIVYVLTHGGPVNSTHLFATLSRQVGLESGRIGEGAAISLYLFPVLVLVVYAQLKFVRKQTY